jgi:hypothetical protein
MKTTALNPGSLEPVTVAELKDFARVASGDLEDALLATLISSSRRQCEEYARISISPRTWQTTYRLPVYVDLGMGLGGSWRDPENVIAGSRVPRGPVLSFTSFQWVLPGELVDVEGYTFNPYLQRIMWNTSWPGVESGAQALVATYEAGFAPVDDGGNPSTTLCDAPAEIKQAVMIVAAHHYEHRAEEKNLFMPVQAQELLRGWWHPAVST